MAKYALEQPEWTSNHRQHQVRNCVLNSDPEPRRGSDWIDRDRALILTSLLAGLRADELLRANVGDIRRTEEGAVVHVGGTGGSLFLTRL